MAKECYFEAGRTNCLTHIPEDIKLELDPLNVTVVGSPTINAGVVSGFSTSNYLKTIPQNITDKSPSASSWEIVFKIEHKAGYQQYFYVQPVSYQSYFGVNASNKMVFKLYNSSSSSGNFAGGEGNTVLTDGGIYWLKYEFTGSAYVMSLSTDGINYTTEYTQSSTTKLADRGVNWLVGVSTQTNYEHPVKGKIDLSESYIKINNEIWWQGGTGRLTLKAGSKVYVPNGFDEDETTPKFDEVVTESDVSNSFTWLISDRALVFLVTGSDGTSLNIGDVDGTIFNNAMSGTTFPTTNSSVVFYKTDENLVYRYNTRNSEWLICRSFPIGIVSAGASGLTSIDQVFNGFGYIGSTVFALPGVKGLASNGFNEDDTYKSVEFTISNPTVFTDPWEAEGNLYYGYHYDSKTISNFFVDELMYDEKNNLISYRGDIKNICIVAEGVQNGGKITSLTISDVVEKSQPLKVNAIYIGSKPTNCLTNIPQDIDLDLDPFNATVVGSPTVSNGVVSGFSSANYVKTPSVFAPGSSSWEFVIKFTSGSSTTAVKPIVGPSALCKSIYLYVKSTTLYFTASGNGTSYNIAQDVSCGTVSANTTYWVKLAFTGSAYQIYISTDGTSFTLRKTVSSSTKIYQASGVHPFYFGIGKGSSTYIFNGKIDLPQSYIKINGEIWWQGGTGTLTLLAGSKIYIPNGFEEDGTTPKFDEVVIDEDLSKCEGWNDERFIYVSAVGNLAFENATHVFCRSTAPSGYQYMIWYDTANNLLKVSGDSGATWTAGQSLPVGTVMTGRGHISSIKEIFNGFGYMEMHGFVLPGVAILSSDGFNPDGTYKSIDYTTDRVIVRQYQYSSSSSDWWVRTDHSCYSFPPSIYIESKIEPTTSSECFWYNPEDNYIRFKAASGTSWTIYRGVRVATSEGVYGEKINSLTPYQVQTNNVPIEIVRGYKGTQLIWGYDPSEAIFQSTTPGTYTVDIEISAYFNVTAVGGGSGGAYVYSSKFSDGRASGGSGAAFVGVVYLEAGTYTVKVGAGGAGKAYESNGQSSATSTAGGASTIGSLITAGGGGAAKAGIHGAAQTAGAGGTLTYDSSKVQSYSVATNGKAGTTKYDSNIAGAASAYSGYGKGGNAGNSYTTAGGNGYVLITSV